MGGETGAAVANENIPRDPAAKTVVAAR